MSEVTAGIVQPAKKVIRVQFFLPLLGEFMCEVTKTASPSNAAEYAVELISGNYDADESTDGDWDAIEEAAIDQADDEWREQRRPLSHGEAQANRNRDEIEEDYDMKAESDWAELAKLEGAAWSK